ncbi:MAG TPA: hypothetical protein VE978_25020 [Chitinophagales bacterium]|nr:hypothetical protein [Chitinophagales bacterium]
MTSSYLGTCYILLPFRMLLRVFCNKRTAENNFEMMILRIVEAYIADFVTRPLPLNSSGTSV